MIMVDFDNTLIRSDFDIKLNPDKSLDWFFKQAQNQTLQNSNVNWSLVDQLQQLDFIVVTARGYETREVTSRILKELFNRDIQVYYCAGRESKLAFIDKYRTSVVLIDDDPIYQPDFLVEGF